MGTLWAIGRVGGIFVVLEQAWETIDGYDQPVWVYSTTQTFTSQKAARVWINAMRRSNLDEVIRETLHRSSAQPLVVGARFGYVEAVYDYLTR